MGLLEYIFKICIDVSNETEMISSNGTRKAPEVIPQRYGLLEESMPNVPFCNGMGPSPQDKSSLE